MDAVTQHGAQPCPIESLPQKIFPHSRLAPRHMGARHQVAPQQRAQCVGIEPVRLDLRIGNQPRLVGMGQHHLLYPFELFKLIVNAAPIPARFHYRLAWPSQARKKLSETKRRVALHAGFSLLPASLIHCAKHTVLLVNVYSNVIHENSSFLFFSTLRTEGLLSFYLTPILLPDPYSTSLLFFSPILYLKLGRLDLADKEKVLGCCISSSPSFPATYHRLLCLGVGDGEIGLPGGGAALPGGGAALPGGGAALPGGGAALPGGGAALPGGGAALPGGGAGEY